MLVKEKNRNIAIAVRDGDDLLLALVVSRSPEGDVYVNWARDYVDGWNPHTSYHASGQYHQKSDGRSFAIQQRQKLDANFRGVEQVISTPLTKEEARSIDVRCNPDDFAAVFEIPVNELRPNGLTRISVDLAEPGSRAHVHSYPPSETTVVLSESTSKDAEPWLLLALFKIGEGAQ